MIDAATYATERAICDKAHAYARVTMAAKGKGCNWLSAEEAAHPDYAACNNEMRGRVEQYEIIRDMPERFAAYVSSDGKHITVWTGDVLGTCEMGAPFRAGWGNTKQYSIRATINGVRYVGRGQGEGMCVMLRKSRAKD